MSIDSCYEEVIAKLTSQGKIVSVSKKLLSCTTNSERVQHAYRILNDLNAFPDALQVTKSNDLSTYYRNHGNQCFKKSDDFEAWQYYNLSLLHAPIESNDYALALSNRSAVFFSLKKFTESLKDIRKVLSMKYPEKLKDKLIKRQTSCEQNLKEEQKDSSFKGSDKIDNIVKFQSTRDCTYLCASSKLQVAFSKTMGRHVIAREDIKVGEVLVEENPYLILQLKPEYLFSCSYCLSREMNLFPCENCCFTLYCSQNCKEKAWKEYHCIECPLMPALVDLKFTKLELLALRTTIKARNDHSDWDSLLKTIEFAESNLNSQHRGCIVKDKKWIYDSENYVSIHTLASNIEKRSVSDIFQKSVTAAVFLKFLLDKTPFLNDDIKIRNCVSEMLLLHIMTSPTNMHGLSTNRENHEGHFVDEVSLASAPYAFHSLLNHSCAPNVVRFSKLGSARMSLVALRPIKKGMQIFDNYGPHHALEDCQTRQSKLKFQYKFICSCEACDKTWPTYLDMKLGFSQRKTPERLHTRKERLLSYTAIENLQKGDLKTALDMFQPLCELTEALDVYAPCVDLADCQESLKQCLVIFQGIVPYGYSKVIEWEARPYNKSRLIGSFLNTKLF